jgi:large subunit ribosomal protein L15
MPNEEPIGIHNISPAEGSVHRRKRVGRGIGSGHGKTSTRGHKGNKARGQVNPNFEGGQTPLHRRLPHLRGVASRNPHGFKTMRDRRYALVNLNVLEQHFEAGAEITPEALQERGLLRDLHFGLKVLGDGDLSKKFTVHAHKFSQSAQEKIQAAGGAAETLPPHRRK